MARHRLLINPGCGDTSRRLPWGEQDRDTPTTACRDSTGAHGMRKAVSRDVLPWRVSGPGKCSQIHTPRCWPCRAPRHPEHTPPRTDYRLLGVGEKVKTALAGAELPGRGQRHWRRHSPRPGVQLKAGAGSCSLGAGLSRASWPSATGTFGGSRGRCSPPRWGDRVAKVSCAHKNNRK